MAGDILTILAATSGRWITSGQKAGPARRADRILTEGMSERGAFRDQPIQIRRPDMRIAERVDRIKALVLGTDPEDVRKWHGMVDCRWLTVSG